MKDRPEKLSRIKRWAIIGILCFFMFPIVLPVVLLPQPANALFGVGDTSITIGDLPRQISETVDVAKETLKKFVKQAADIAFKNVLKNYLNALAYNYAVELATGEKGQKPYFVGDPLGMLKDAGDAAAGDFLDAVASDWIGKSRCQGYTAKADGSKGCKADSSCQYVNLECPNGVQYDCGSSIEEKNKCLAAGCRVIECSDIDCYAELGAWDDSDRWETHSLTIGAPECVSSFSLCDLGEPSLKVKLTIMVTDELLYDRSTVDTGQCPITDIIDKYDEYREMIKSGTTAHADPNKKYLFEFSKSLNPEATEFGAYLSILDQARLEKATNEKATEFAQGLAGEFKPVKSKISGLVKTPATFMSGVGTSLFGKSIDPYMTYTGSVIADAVGIFTNTLATKLIERYLFGIDDEKSARQASGGVFGGSSAGISAAKIRFADLKETSYSVGGEIDILSKLASCPDSKDPTPDTCVIDSRFSTAITQEITVREALDEGLLDGTKPFGFDLSGNQPEYYNGYPYRSLVILRKYRIIPVGWELAAKYIEKYVRGNYSLNTLIAEYDNQNSPFYRLIDPNWVLKVPALYCKKQGAGPKVMFSSAIRGEDTNEDGAVDKTDAASTLLQRQDDYCADEQQCIKENEDGSCTKYGYCIEEEPLWKFDSKVCEPEYSSCETLTSSGGGEASYLLNTVNKNSCNVSNAGCQWYCQDFDYDENNWLCGTQKPASAGDEKISFNANVSQCNTSTEGCNEFMKIRDTGTNLVLNSGFESFGAYPPIYDGIKDSVSPDWFSQGGAVWYDGDINNVCGTQAYAVSDSYEGLTAVKLRSDFPPCAPGSWMDEGYFFYTGFDTGYPTNNRTFTISFFAKQASDDADCSDSNGRIGIHTLRVPTVASPSYEWINVMNITTSQKWTRYTGQVAFEELDFISSLDNQLFIWFEQEGGDQCDVIIDGVQVENSQLTSYKKYEESPRTYFRKPPGYLDCQGAETDNSACNNYSLMCAASEVGCEKYTSQTTNNSITGVITSPDVCQSGNPASCDQCPEAYVGCQAFRELPIEHMPLRPARDPISFLPDTGTSCPASAVGCEEYTNLEEVAAGGEGKEYYSFVRICVEPDDPEIVPYYTWEGSDEFGYQLKKYDLKQSNVAGDDGPCTNVGAENDPALAAAGIDWPACVDDVDIDGDGTIDYPAATCDAADVGVNPDCTEFYDATGHTYYRLRSRLIYASDNCKSYKNSVDSTATCTDTICTNTGLTCFDADGNGSIDDEDCRGAIYHMIPGEGVSCAPSYAGCRSYKGNAGDNVRNLYYEDFENGTVGSWIGNVSYSNESMNLNGHSMVVANSAAINNVGTSLEMRDDRIYTLSFWAKSAVGSPVPVAATINSAPPLTFSGQAITNDQEWNRFEIGPLYVPRGFDISTSQLIISGESAFYIDNIRITEVYDNKYLIKDTFTECSGWEGCDAYNDRAGSTHYLKSFSYLCREDRVGCDAFIDTKNSETAERLQYRTASYLRGDVNDDGAVNINDVTVLDNYVYPPNISFAPVPLTIGDLDEDSDVDADDITFLRSYITATIEPANKYYYIEPFVDADSRTNYYVYDSAKSCGANTKGCERLGRPIIDGDGALIAYENTYLVNNPDEYGTDMCLYNEAGCQEYTSTDGGRYYFKDPGQSICEFKRVPGQTASGWYKTGTQSGVPDCPVATGLCGGGGANDDAPCNSGDDCDSGFCSRFVNIVEQPVDGWTGLCPADKSGCTEYRDPEESSLISEDASPNLFPNGRMEDFVTTANPAIWTDGVIDAPYIGDEFPYWANNTAQGVCVGGVRAGLLCSNNSGCGRCIADPSRFCAADGDCDPADSCDIAGGTCDKTTMFPCGNRLLATSDASEGDTAAINRIYPECTHSTDPAMYTWADGGIDTGSLTDNRRFKLTFSAKRNPDDPSCVGLALADPDNLANIGANLYRTVDDRPAPNGYQDTGGGRGWNVSDVWEEYEYTYSFGAVPLLGIDGLIHDWVATGASLEHRQAYVDFVFRRGRNPAFTADQHCDIIIDNVRLQEVIGEFDYTPYYYLSGTVDKSECNGLVSREEGCRLFDDTSAFDLTYSSADSKNGEPPALCAGTGDCDSNTVIKVLPDRECAKWLECESSLRQEDAEGSVEELCLSRYICDEMDDQTGHCTHTVEYENVDQTFSSPAFAENIRFLSGMVLTGLDWDKRCKNDPNITCANDAQCGVGGVCDDPQVVEGKLLYPAMREYGSVATSPDLIKHGDMGDGDYTLNRKLSCPLSRDPLGAYPANCEVVDYDGENEILLKELSASWMPRDWFDGDNDIFWAEEDANYGLIPSETGNLDENNVVIVRTGGYTGDDKDGDGNIGSAQENGIAYDLGSNIIQGEDYVVSFRMKWGGPVSVYDMVRVEFGYRNLADEEFRQVAFGPDIVPSSKWKEYTVGPIAGGVDEFGNDVENYIEAQLNIIHIYNGIDTVPPVEFYLDDVSMQPALQVKEDGTLLSRSCRLYPQNDSPACSYVDENNSIYSGWEGYCLERDPSNPKYCLNWWPVDMLKGESDAFSALRAAGYSGRVPLYYCAKAQDLDPAPPRRQAAIVASTSRPGSDAALPRATCVVRTGWHDGSNDSCKIWALMSDPKPLYYEIINDPGTNWGVSDWRIGQSYTYLDEIAAATRNQYFCEDFGGANCVDDCWNIRGETGNLHGGNDGTDNVFCNGNNAATCGGTSFSGCAMGDGNEIPAGCQGNYPGLLREVYHKVVLYHWVHDDFANNTNWRSCNDDDGEQSYSEYGSWCALTDGGINTTDARCAGEYAGDRFDGFQEIGNVQAEANDFALVNRIPRPQECEAIVEAVDFEGSNKAWAERIEGSFTLDGHPLDYARTVNCPPFGAMPQMDDPNAEICIDWDSNGSCNLGGLTHEYYPLQLFHGSNPLNNDPAEVCTKTILGSGYMACGRGIDWPDFTSDNCSTTENWGLTPELATTEGWGRIKRLFADLSDYWHYRDVGGGIYRYVQEPATIAGIHSDYQFMDPCPYINAQGRAVRPQWDPANPDDEYCGVPPVIDDIMVGSVGLPEATDYVKLSGGGTIQLTFTIKADPEQVPIRYINVDWGDGTSHYETVGNYDSGTVFLTHEYQVSGLHEPKILIYDNWGWCGVEMEAGLGSCLPPDDCRHFADGDECSHGDRGFVSSGIKIDVTQ